MGKVAAPLVDRDLGIVGATGHRPHVDILGTCILWLLNTCSAPKATVGAEK